MQREPGFFITTEKLEQFFKDISEVFNQYFCEVDRLHLHALSGICFCS
jgi:hypothetical protein